MAFGTTSNSGKTGANTSQQYDFNLTSGSLLVAVARAGNTADAPTGFSDDSANGAWEFYTAGPDDDGNHFAFGYYLNNSSTTTSTVTAAGTLTNPVMTIFEITYTATLTEQNTFADSVQTNASGSSMPSADVTVPAGTMLALGVSAHGNDATVTPNTSNGDTWINVSANARCNLMYIFDASDGTLRYEPTLSAAKESVTGLLILGEATGGGIIPQAMHHYRNNTGSGL